MGEFGATSFIIRPDSNFLTIPIAIERYLSQPGALNIGQAVAMSTILLLVCATGFIAIDRFGMRILGSFRLQAWSITVHRSYVLSPVFPPDDSADGISAYNGRGWVAWVSRLMVRQYNRRENGLAHGYRYPDNLEPPDVPD